jgi:hypothetical protein
MRRSERGQPAGLTLEQVARELPPLDAPGNIRCAYETIQRWAACGLLAGSVAGACVRACDGALKLYEAELDREHVRTLEQRVKELEAELAKPAALRKVVSR